MDTEKTQRREELKDRISEVHDMQAGQAFSWEGCGVSGTDICRICELRHHWGRGGQNSGDFDTYEDAKGNHLTLAEAARATCD